MQAHLPAIDPFADSARKAGAGAMTANSRRPWWVGREEPPCPHRRLREAWNHLRRSLRAGGARPRPFEAWGRAAMA